MLDTEEKVVEKEPKKEVTSENMDESKKKYLEQYKNKEKIRDGLPSELPIYFKMRAKFYQRIKPEVEKKQSIDEKNKLIKELKEASEKQKM